jgi:hypothetical protein
LDVPPFATSSERQDVSATGVATGNVGWMKKKKRSAPSPRSDSNSSDPAVETLERCERHRYAGRMAVARSSPQLRITVSDARRSAIAAQRIVGAPAATRKGILQLVRDIGYLQLDPINVVARNPQLILWTRLGRRALAARVIARVCAGV